MSKKATARVVVRLVFITKGRLSPTFVFRTGPRREIAHCLSLRVPQSLGHAVLNRLRL
jgi:hypothetical protein